MLKLEFIGKLREIALRSPKSQEEMKTLEAECIELMREIRDFGFANTCPDTVWHYLTDVDIRYKDPEYAKYQNPLFILRLMSGSRQMLPNPSFKRDALKRTPYVKR